MNLAEFYARARALAPAGRPVIVSVNVQSPAFGGESEPPIVRWDIWIGPVRSNTPGTRFEATTAETCMAKLAEFYAEAPAPVPPVTDDGLAPTVKP